MAAPVPNPVSSEIELLDAAQVLEAGYLPGGGDIRQVYILYTAEVKY